MSGMPSVKSLDPPKDRRLNLEYRKTIEHFTHVDAAFKKDLLGRCAEDFPFWCDSFAWVYEPRPDIEDRTAAKIKPFTLWPHQLRAYRELERDLGFQDIGVIKSRGEGASWVFIAAFVWGWRFKELEAYGLVSRNELCADNPDDPDSLMWKAEMLIRRMPDWMCCEDDYKRNRAKHNILHKETRSSIVAYAATGDVARGGRKTAFLMDEFAAFALGDDSQALDATRDVTNCRIFLSTPKGPLGAFYDIMRNPGSMRKIELWWHQNPTKNQGLYKVQEGRVALLDLSYWKARIERPDMLDEDAQRLARLIKEDDEGNNAFRYKFMLSGEFVKEGAYRSVWYDAQCRRPGTSPRSIAQELDGDFGGSASRYFSATRIDELISKYAVNPVWQGDVLFDIEHPTWNVRLAESPSGRLKIWDSLRLMSLKANPQHNYVVSADIATGTGGEYGSNSVVDVINRTTKKLVASYVAPDTPPADLAEISIALCKFFTGPGGEALLCPERNGVGVTFVKRCLDLGWRHFYMQRMQDTRSRGKTKKIGWWNNDKHKSVLFGEFNRALMAEEFVIPDKHCLEECKSYMLTSKMKIEHTAALSADDPAGAGDNHGDRVIAAAVGWYVVSEMAALGGDVTGKSTGNQLTRNAPINSIGGRMRESSRRRDSQQLW